MNYQYMIWEINGQLYHVVFNQLTKLIVYPPSHPFLYKPIRMTVMWYEGMQGKLIDQGTWEGDKIHEYIQAMQKLHPKTLSKATDNTKPKRDMSQEDSSTNRVSDSGSTDGEQPDLDA